jgi:hypothetical protein
MKLSLTALALLTAVAADFSVQSVDCSPGSGYRVLAADANDCDNPVPNDMTIENRATDKEHWTFTACGHDVQLADRTIVDQLPPTPAGLTPMMPDLIDRFNIYEDNEVVGSCTTLGRRASGWNNSMKCWNAGCTVVQYFTCTSTVVKR